MEDENDQVVPVDPLDAYQGIDSLKYDSYRNKPGMTSQRMSSRRQLITEISTERERLLDPKQLESIERLSKSKLTNE